MAASRKGRGHLSSIDLLPDEADNAVTWAYNELIERSTLQNEIHKEFNEKLAVIGLGPISKSAFNRHSLRLARDNRKKSEALMVATAMSERRDLETVDDLTILLSETIKTIVYEMLCDDKLSPKDALELARAFQAAVNSEKVSVKRRREMNEAFETQVDEALTKVVEEKGLGKDRADALKRELLGLKT